MRSGRLLQAIAAAAALGCSSDGGANQPTPPGGNTALTVTVANNQFVPSTLSVPVNSTVTWRWNPGGVLHNVTFDDGSKSADLTSGSFPRTFQTPGTYPYRCTFHAAQGMTGTVTVTAAPSSGDTGGGSDGGGTGGGGDGYP